MTKEEKRLKHNKYNNTWAKAHRKNCRIQAKKWRDKRSALLMNMKIGKSCMYCGESDVVCLDFHHREPEKKSYNIQRMMMSTTNDEIILKEIEKCDIVCANCHRKIHQRWKMVE